MVLGETLTTFVVKFDDNKTAYQRGENVSGRVEIQPESAITMKALNIRFLSKMRVRWTEHYGKQSVTYSKTQKLFNETLVVGNSAGSQGEATTLSPTLHTFPFSFKLPDDIPGSYQDGTGFIHYEIKAAVDNRRHKTKAYFDVPPLLDLNSKQNMLVPSAVEMDRMVCCWCCSSGPINVKFRTDRTGYVPGETITINGEVNNRSNSGVSKVSIKLIKKVTYITNSKSRRVFSTIAKQTLMGCRPGGTVSIVNEKLVVPPTYPSDCRPCVIMEFDYSVRVRVRYRGLKYLVKAPIVIGTVPLSNEPGAQRDPLPTQTASAIPMSVPSSFTTATNESGQRGNETTGGSYYNWNNQAFTYN